MDAGYVKIRKSEFGINAMIKLLRLAGYFAAIGALPDPTARLLPRLVAISRPSASLPFCRPPATAAGGQCHASDGPWNRWVYAIN